MGSPQNDQFWFKTQKVNVLPYPLPVHEHFKLPDKRHFQWSLAKCCHCINASFTKCSVRCYSLSSVSSSHHHSNDRYRPSSVSRCIFMSCLQSYPNLRSGASMLACRMHAIKTQTSGYWWLSHQLLCGVLANMNSDVMTCPEGRHLPYFTLFHVLMKFHLHFWNFPLRSSALAQRARSATLICLFSNSHQRWRRIWDLAVVLAANKTAGGTEH